MDLVYIDSIKGHPVLTKKDSNKVSENTHPRLRTYGFMAVMLLIGISIGLLLYPLIVYPAIWSWVILGISIVLLAITSLSLRR